MKLKLALAGNPNCGKTTLFNALTGSAQYVGNWPGVTVEKKEGKLKGNHDVIIQDLPGIYSLSPYTMEEVVSRNYLVNEKPDAIINIIDATNIERNLYLTTQILELNIPVVIALNMMDIVKKNGDRIDVAELSSTLGCPVVPISALKKEGGDLLITKAVELAKNRTKHELPHVYSGSVEHAIAHIEESISDIVEKTNLRWYAIKIFERDEKVLEAMNFDVELRQHLEEHIEDCEKELDDDSESIITNQRYEFVKNVTKMSIVKNRKAGSLTFSDKIDRIVTNRILALPIFVVVMTFVYYISVTSIGTIVTDWTNDTLFGEWIQPAVQGFMENNGASEWAVSLVVDGVIGGIAAPIGFAPQMAIVFLFLSLLEDCGYMARVAFIMDRVFRRFGLSGKSFIPFLISSGCGVPGIMATRTIENEKDRRMTMMTTTNIPCGAKLPVIAAIAGFIMGGAWWAAPMMYFVGILVVICSCIILKKSRMFAGEPAPFVMELPQYHMPSMGGVLIHVWERVWAFIKKAGTILFACCVVMWFLATFGFGKDGFGMVDVDQSLLAVIGGWMAIAFIPLGFANWQAVAATISGFTAKEAIVSTMGVLAGVGAIDQYSNNMHGAFASFFPTTMIAVSFLFFNLFNSPCLAAISTVAKEMNSRKYFWFAILFQNIFSYILSMVVYRIGGLINGDLSFDIWSVISIVFVLVFLFMLFRPVKKKNEHYKEAVNRI